MLKPVTIGGGSGGGGWVLCTLAQYVPNGHIVRPGKIVAAAAFDQWHHHRERVCRLHERGSQCECASVRSLDFKARHHAFNMSASI